MTALVPALLLGLLVLAPSALADVFTPESGGSPNADRLDTLYKVVLYIAIVVFVGVESALLYSLVKFRARKGRVAAQIHGNTRLELAWTAGAALILVVLASVTFAELGKIKNPDRSGPGGLSTQLASLDQSPVPGGKALKIQVNGQQFLWRFTYPNGVYAYTEMVVPEKTTVTLDIVAQDVAHSWWIPKMGGKFDAVPGKTNYAWFKAPAAGKTFTGQCAELCGAGHATMIARVRVVTVPEFQAWLDQQKTAIAATQKAGAAGRQAEEANKPLPGEPQAEPTTPAPTPPSAAAGGTDLAAGRQVFTGAGCGACHTLADAGAAGKVGPNLDQALGKDPKSAILSQIVDPNASVEKPYVANVMPKTYGTSLSKADLTALVDYIYQVTKK